MALIKLTVTDTDFLQTLHNLATEIEVSFEPYEDGYRFMPDEIYAIHGVQVAREGDVWSFWREPDATSIEDFLLLHIAHRLAHDLGIELEYEWSSTSRKEQPTPEHFETFEAYADYVTRNDEGVLKDSKIRWLYDHMERPREQ
jgi:hypothetical protein